MTWTEFPWNTALTFAVLFATIGILALRENLRSRFADREDVVAPDGKPRFAGREDVDASLKRVHLRIDSIADDCQATVKLFTNLDGRVGELEADTRLLAERQTQQWERISEQMANTARSVESVAGRMEKIAEMQQAQALRLERLNQSQKGA